MAIKSASMAIKSLKQIITNDIITSATEIYNWDKIETHSQNMLSFKHSTQRINIWIKKNMKITIRIQPMEYVKKDTNISDLSDILKECNDILQNKEFHDEGQ